MTMSLRRPGMAWPAFALLASEHSRFRFPERVSTPSVALGDMWIRAWCRARVVWCVEASEKKRYLKRRPRHDPVIRTPESSTMAKTMTKPTRTLRTPRWLLLRFMHRYVVRIRRRGGESSTSQVVKPMQSRQVNLILDLTSTVKNPRQSHLLIPASTFLHRVARASRWTPIDAYRCRVRAWSSCLDRDRGVARTRRKRR